MFLHRIHASASIDYAISFFLDCCFAYVKKVKPNRSVVVYFGENRTNEYVQFYYNLQDMRHN